MFKFVPLHVCIHLPVSRVHTRNDLCLIVLFWARGSGADERGSVRWRLSRSQHGCVDGTSVARDEKVDGPDSPKAGVDHKDPEGRYRP